MISPAPGNRAPRRTSATSTWLHLDVALVLATVAIAAFGVLMIYTATRDQLQIQGLAPTYYAKKQAIFLVLGVVVMGVLAAIDYRRFRDWAVAIYGLSVLMLMAVYVVGHKSKGAQAWFQFGSYQFEPSEFAKIGLILALAAYTAQHRGRLTTRSLAVLLALAAIPFALIYKQPDLGSALVLAAVLLGVLVVGGTPGRHLAVLALVTVVGMFGVVHFGVLKTYQRDRLTSFVNTPDQPNTKLLATAAGQTQYNLAESKITIGDGGLLGKGIGKGTQTNLSYVPEQRTDFIFTAVGEQVGLVGSGLLLALFAVVAWRIWRAAALARDQVGTLICIGVLGMLVFQIFENMGMTMGIMPIAGIPLPFMSYGGSAELACFAGIGLVLNVRMRRFS
ncbi:MAG TPA: rod shape-determining protein RodA [Acidimicrobiales bacterium]|nr:rod shape-determining protein RodA [Acidimicrobiales bacterium]